MSSRLNFLSISPRLDLRARCETLCQEFHFSYLALQTAEELKNIPFEQIQFILTDSLGSLKEIRQKFKDAFIVALASESDSQANIASFKSAGANHVFRQSALFKKSYLEYVASQVIRAAFVPVKVSEFPVNAILEFSLYHLMPLNQKLLPVLPKGSALDESRLKKLEGIGEVFVRRDEIDRYRMYVESHPANSAQGQKSKCRAQYLSLSNAHAQLVFLVCDSEESATDKEAKWLAERCDILGRQLLMTLSALSESWDVLNNSSVGEMGSVERAPTIAAYAGLISFLASIGDPSEVMMAGLLNGVGMLELHPDISKKLRQSFDLTKLNPEELREYQLHPSESIHVCEIKKIPLKDSVKNIILNSHEKINGGGFPNHKKDRIPEEAMLLQFCEMVDREALVKMGQARQPVKDVRMKIMTELFKDGQTLSPDFLKKLNPVI